MRGKFVLGNPNLWKYHWRFTDTPATDDDFKSCEAAFGLKKPEMRQLRVKQEEKREQSVRACTLESSPMKKSRRHRFSHRLLDDDTVEINNFAHCSRDNKDTIHPRPPRSR